MEEKSYELSNHLGNVHITLSDYRRKEEDGLGVAYYSQVKSASDYYPFGQLLTEGNYSAEDYRFGFNGKEMDNEVKGTGNSYDFGARIYSPRIGRWMAVDPKAYKYPELTPYSFVGNMAINAIDPDGEEIVIMYATGTDKAGYPIHEEYTYGSSQKVPDNEYVRQTIKALEALENSETIGDEVKKLKNSTKWNVEVREIFANRTGGFHHSGPNTEEPVNNRYIEFNTSFGLMDNETGNKFAPFIALGHELGHAYSYYFAFEEHSERIQNKSEKWRNKEEKYNIKTYEIPLVKEFKARGNNLLRTEYKKDSYMEFKTTGVLSAEPDNKMPSRGLDLNTESKPELEQR